MIYILKKNIFKNVYIYFNKIKFKKKKKFNKIKFLIKKKTYKKND